MQSRPLLGAALVALLPACAAGFELIPVARVDILGGQYFFEGQQTSFSGNANWLFSPGLKLGERDALIPVVSGQYRRTREVQELIGGGFLTSESLDNTAALKWVHLLSADWNVKPQLSYKHQMITESIDEKLGKGLFDYHKFAFGTELEWTGGEVLKSVRGAFNSYQLRFYRYHALSSQSAALGAEVNSGDRVLDFDAYELSAAADAVPRDGTMVSASFLASMRPYRDQKVVTLTGEYEDSDRRDLYLIGAAAVRQALPDWGGFESAAGLNSGVTRVFSTQHNFDAQNTRYNEDYYDYLEASAGPFFATRFRKSLTLTAGYDFSFRAYDRRPAQDPAGLYSANAIRMRTHTVSVSAGYPIWRGLSARLQGTYRRAASNMLYESTYRYNYYAAYYFAGLSWEL